MKKRLWLISILIVLCLVSIVYIIKLEKLDKNVSVENELSQNIDELTKLNKLISIEELLVEGTRISVTQYNINNIDIDKYSNDIEKIKYLINNLNLLNLKKVEELDKTNEISYSMLVNNPKLNKHIIISLSKDRLVIL